MDLKSRRLRDKIEEESKKSPANQALISSLQGELAAVQAKYQGEGMMLANQRAIMMMVGEENVGESFRAAAEGEWVGANRGGVAGVWGGVWAVKRVSSNSSGRGTLTTCFLEI